MVERILKKKQFEFSHRLKVCSIHDNNNKILRPGETKSVYNSISTN